MARPRKCRMVRCDPGALFYKPRGIPLRRLEVAELAVEGLEAMRLADAEGLSHAEAAKRMEISPATFCRVLAQARKTVATALAGGMAISVKGGAYAVVKEEVKGGLDE